jgi:hypothetical protein
MGFGGVGVVMRLAGFAEWERRDGVEGNVIPGKGRVEEMKRWEMGGGSMVQASMGGGSMV